MTTTTIGHAVGARRRRSRRSRRRGAEPRRSVAQARRSASRSRGCAPTAIVRSRPRRSSSTRRPTRSRSSSTTSARATPTSRARSTRSRSKRPRSARRASSRGTARAACSTMRSAGRSRTPREGEEGPLVVLQAPACAGSSSQRSPDAPVARSAPPPTPVPMDAPAARPLGPVPDRSSCRRAHRRSAPRRTPRNRPGHPIDVILRSTPQRAEAAVDGVPLGPTPAYWNGIADGHEHEFTFVLPGHAVARYRFVPITSGVIHARLEPISDDQADAGCRRPAARHPGDRAVAPPIPIDAPAPPPIDAAPATHRRRP